MTIRIKTLVFLISFITYQKTFSQNASIVHEGHYSGENIYVQNPFSGNQTSFCVDSVTINGVLTAHKIKESAFEIDLVSLNFKEGELLLIRIFHKADCLPKILNPRVGGYVRSKTKFTDIRIE